MTATAPGSAAGTAEPLTIDDLARQVRLPVRTIREYHTMRLLPPPERRGRVGLYGPGHVQRLQLIARLQRRGYSLAGIRDLLGAWESGTDLTTLLGVDQGQAVLDEPPLRLTRAELLQRLPALEDRAALDRAREAGLVSPQGEDHVIVRSPALLALAADWVEAGVPLAEALGVIEVLAGDLGALARTLAGLIADRVRPGVLPAVAGTCPACSGAACRCCSRAWPPRWRTGSGPRWPNGPKAITGCGPRSTTSASAS